MIIKQEPDVGLMSFKNTQFVAPAQCRTRIKMFLARRKKFHSRFLLVIYRADFSRVEKTSKEKRSADISLDSVE